VGPDRGVDLTAQWYTAPGRFERLKSPSSRRDYTGVGRAEKRHDSRISLGACARAPRSIVVWCSTAEDPEGSMFLPWLDACAQSISRVPEAPGRLAPKDPSSSRMKACGSAGS